MPPPEPKPTPADEETATVEPTGASPAEIAFEPPEPGDGTAIPTSEEAPRDNPTPSTTASQTTTTIAAAEPQMGDTRTADGQNQIYIVGFGWIADCGGGGEGIFVDGDGDINKMVGIMGEE